MSETHTIDRTEIRRTVREALDAEDMARDELVATIATETETPDAAVSDEIDALEKHGFVYIVNGEVRKV